MPTWQMEQLTSYKSACGHYRIERLGKEWGLFRIEDGKMLASAKKLIDTQAACANLKPEVSGRDIEVDEILRMLDEVIGS